MPVEIIEISFAIIKDIIDKEAASAFSLCCLPKRQCPVVFRQPTFDWQAIEFLKFLAKPTTTLFRRSTKDILDYIRSIKNRLPSEAGTVFVRFSTKSLSYIFCCSMFYFFVESLLRSWSDSNILHMRRFFFVPICPIIFCLIWWQDKFNISRCCSESKIVDVCSQYLCFVKYLMISWSFCSFCLSRWHLVMVAVCAWTVLCVYSSNIISNPERHGAISISLFRFISVGPRMDKRIISK